MSFSTSTRLLPQRFRMVLASFLQHPGLPFADVLPEEQIQSALEDQQALFAQDGDDVVYTPAITLWAFLSQVLYKAEQRSCVAAVMRVAVLWGTLGKQISTNTGAYCRARSKLSATALERLTLDLARGCEQQARKSWLWHGRHVYLVDGTTVSMPDTESNQQAWPQASTQEAGLGFPIARLVVLLSLATGLATGMAMGKYSGKETGETALFRKLLRHLSRGDIVLADRYYCSYFMIALLREFGVDCVLRLHQMRPADMRGGRRLGKGDRIVRWMRPAKPEWMDEATYQRMPESLEVRQVKVQVKQAGFRDKSLIVVTTLTDARRYTKEDIAELYHQRWLAELDILAIKVTLGMDVLRCQTPPMVESEIWTCLLAYNLIRRTILQAAMHSKQPPRHLSFTAAMQAIAAGWVAVLLMDDSQRAMLAQMHLENIAMHRVGNRPNRVEPRAIKRRPKSHDWLTKPRGEARAELLRRRAA
jgi:hypothetical protein